MSFSGVQMTPESAVQIASEPLFNFAGIRTYGENLRAKLETRGFCMLVRSNRFFQKFMDYYRHAHNDATLVIYSMWSGYLIQPESRLHDMIDGFSNVIHLHSSGHADIKTIIDVCKVVSPRNAIIPIHSTNSRRLSDLGLPYHIEYLDDGQTYNL